MSVRFLVRAKISSSRLRRPYKGEHGHFRRVFRHTAVQETWIPGRHEHRCGRYAADVRELIESGAGDIRWSSREIDVSAAHVFATRSSDLRKHLRRLRDSLQPAGFVWVSWPKRASGVPTDISENLIRDIALPLKLVDIKVCAVTEVWSGLKLVIPVKDRK